MPSCICWLAVLVVEGHVAHDVQVHLLVRGPKLRASAAMQDRVRAHPKVTVHLNTGVQDAYPDAKGKMGGLVLTDSTTGEYTSAA